MNAITAPERAAVSPLGLVPGLDIDAYHQGPGISKSGLDDMDASPFIFHARHLDPQRPPHQAKAGQLEGQLAHCAVLEPDEFDKRYAVGPDVSRSTKVWKAFEDINPGRVCIKPDQHAAAWRQADSIRRLPEVAEALARGAAEVSAYWDDPTTGALCRCRPDWHHPCGQNQVVLLDVKTYSDASPGEFRRQVARKRYHVQDAFYSDGFSIASGLEVLAFIFVAVETEWPYAANALLLDEQARAQGRRDYRRNLDTYAECLRTGVWPGYGNAIHVINLPNWAITE